MKVSILTAATSSYAFALEKSIKSIKQAICGRRDQFTYMLATNSDSVADLAKRAWGNEEFKCCVVDVDDQKEKYKEASQLIIAELQGRLFEMARESGADMAWSVESDVLVHPDSYAGLLWTLDSPMPKYGVATSTYWNGQFLCGRGSTESPIMEDYTIDERQVPEKEATLYKKLRQEIQKQPAKPNDVPEFEKKQKEYFELSRKIQAYPPTKNVFALNAKAWRRRGWLDAAYPGAAVKGAVLPTDWCGLGCALLGRDALSRADFFDYDGKGTQDLYLCYQKWLPAGLRIGLNVSVPATHVKKTGDDLVHYVPFFVASGEFEGHLRMRFFKAYSS